MLPVGRVTGRINVVRRNMIMMKAGVRMTVS
jgi:hypothetical protein